MKLTRKCYIAWIFCFNLFHRCNCLQIEITRTVQGDTFSSEDCNKYLATTDTAKGCKCNNGNAGTLFTNRSGVLKCYYGVAALEGTIFSTRLKEPLNLNRVYLVRYATEYLQYFKNEYYKKEQQHDNNPKSVQKTNKQTI